MSAQNVFLHLLRTPAAIAFLLATASLCVAGTEKDFFQGSDLTLAGNYNPAGLPTNNSDVVLTTPTTALTLNATALQMGSLNMTANNVAYTISNNTATSAGSSLSLDPFMGGGNSISGQTGDAIFLGGMNSSLTLQGANGGTGSGGLSLGSNSGGSLNVAQASSTLNISASIAMGLGGSLTKTGAGVLNLSGPLSIAGSGNLIVNQGTANLLSGFTAAANIFLTVNNSAAGPASDVILNIQSSLQFRSLSGSLAGPAAHATLNLVGAGTQLSLFEASGTFAGSITGSGSVVVQSGSHFTETFSGNNTYSGTTRVNEGTLRIDGSTSGQGSYTIVGGTLSGSGTVGLSSNGTVTLQDGFNPSSHLGPGASGVIGTLSVTTSGTGGVIFRDTSVFTVDIGALGISDLLAIGGGYIDLTGSGDKLELNGLAGAFDGSTYTIATFGQNLSGGTFNTVTGLPANYSVTYTSTSIMLLPVPEPGTIALGAEFCGLLLYLKWLRKNKTAARA